MGRRDETRDWFDPPPARETADAEPIAESPSGANLTAAPQLPGELLGIPLNQPGIPPNRPWNPPNRPWNPPNRPGNLWSDSPPGQQVTPPESAGPDDHRRGSRGTDDHCR